MASSG
jgi:hypothetical protein